MGEDKDLERIVSDLRSRDPNGATTARVLRETFDQLYDGQRTGRYRWDQLHKTEKTHFGTLIEINLHRAFGFGDGELLDYRIAGVEVDCKYSQTRGTWMFPPEARNHLCMVVWASDEASTWGLGVVRASDDLLAPGSNRDGKVRLNPNGQRAIRWLFDEAELPPNILLRLPPGTVERIMSLRSGMQRVNELFRNTLEMRVGRGVVATVARQADYMKRVRANGGSRTALKPEGIIILGPYTAHSRIAHSLGVPVPQKGELVPVRVAPADSPGPGVAEIEGRLWRVAGVNDPAVEAPDLPKATERL